MKNVMQHIFLRCITNNRRQYQSRHWFATLIVLVLTVVHMPLASASLVSGGIVSGTILASNEEHNYTFTANAGQSIVLRAGRTGGALTPYIRLYNPSGSLIGDAGGATGRDIDHQAIESGTYTVIVSDYYSNLGDYNLHFVLAPGLSEGGVVSSGSAYAGMLDSGDLDSYSINANAGESIAVRAGKLNGDIVLYLRLYSPSGSLVGDAGNAAAPVIYHQAVESGTYTVVVTEDRPNFISSGDYNIHFFLAPGASEGGFISNGDALVGTLDEGDLDSYSFTANTGALITVSASILNGDIFPYLRLYSPSGSLAYNDSGNPSVIYHQAVQNGTYTVVVTEQYYTSTTGEYSLSFDLVPATTQLRCDLNNNGKVDAGDLSQVLRMVVDIIADDLDCDINNAGLGDGAISTADLVIVTRIVTGIIPEIVN